MEFIHCDGLGIQTLTDYSMSSRKPKPKPKEKPVLTEESLKGASSALLTAVEGTEGGGRAAEDNRLPDLVQNRPPEPVPEDRRGDDGEDGDDEREKDDGQADDENEDAEVDKDKKKGKPKSKAEKKKDLYGRQYKESSRSNRMQKRQEKEEEEKEKQAEDDKRKEREKRKARKHKLEELARKQEERKQKQRIDAEERRILQQLARRQKEEEKKRAKETPAQTKYRNMVMAERCQKERNKKTDESHALMEKWLESHDLGAEARRVAREQQEKARKIEQERQRQARSRKSLVKVLQTPVEEDKSKPASSRTKPIAPGRVEDIPEPDFRGLEPQNRDEDGVEPQPGTSGLQANVTLTRTEKDGDDDDDDDYDAGEDDEVEIDDVEEELELSNVESDIDEEESQASMKVGPCFHSLNPTQAGLFVAFAEDAVRQFYHAVKRGGEMEENYKLLVRLFRKGIFRCQTYTPISKASTKQVLESIKDVGCMAWVKWKEGAKTGRSTEIATAQRKIERKEEETRKQAKPAKIVAALTDRTEEQRTEIKTKIKTLYRTMGEAHKKAGDVCDMLADLVDEVPEEVFVTIAENTTRPLIHLKVPVMDELCKRQEEAEGSKGIQWTNKPISEVVLYQNLPTPNKRWREKDYLKPTACLAGAIYWYMHRICEPNEILAQDRVGKMFGVPKATFHRVVSGKRYRGGADPKPGPERQTKHKGAGKKSKRTAVEEGEVQSKKPKTSETSGVSGKSSKKQKHGKISKEVGKKALMPKRTDRMTGEEKADEEDVTEMEDRRTVVTSINKQPPRRSTRMVVKAKSPRGRTEEEEEMDLEEELNIADWSEQEKKEYWRLKKVASEVQE